MQAGFLRDRMPSRSGGPDTERENGAMTHRTILAGGTAAAILASGVPAHAQTDYYNTDAGRPVLVEDAYPVERYAFEAQVAPLRLERTGPRAYHWEIEPELAYGILPRTQVEVGLPLVYADEAEEGSVFGVGGIDVSVLHNLNVETRTLPALAVAADVVLPVGGLAPDRVHPSVKGIATRTFSFARFHVNGRYTFGSAPGEEAGAGEESRWMAGVAVDRTFPLRSALVIADLYAEQPLRGGDGLRWTAEVGTRYQLDPFFALDAGIGRRFAGDGQGWFLTFGAARVFAVRSLMPGRSR